jgi:hypothetical protein
MAFYIGSTKVCPIVRNDGFVGVGVPRELATSAASGLSGKVLTLPKKMWGSYTYTLPSNTVFLGDYALAYAFYKSTGLTSADLSSLKRLGHEGPTQVNIDGNTIGTYYITPQYELYHAFEGCTRLMSVNLSGLEGIYYDPLSEIDLHSLECAFKDCTSLSTLSFNSLKQVGAKDLEENEITGMTNMLQGVTGCTVHFPSNLQSAIGSYEDVANGFGGTNTTVLFDLPATA